MAYRCRLIVPLGYPREDGEDDDGPLVYRDVSLPFIPEVGRELIGWDPNDQYRTGIREVVYHVRGRMFFAFLDREPCCSEAGWAKFPDGSHPDAVPRYVAAGWTHAVDIDALWESAEAVPTAAD
jgi:hypothetical protein